MQFDVTKFRDLADYVTSLQMCSTHEHTEFESEYVRNPPDILANLFDNYIINDLAVAGADPESLRRLLAKGVDSIAIRFAGVAEAWSRAQYTGYGEAVKMIAKALYGIEEIDGLALEHNQTRYCGSPGERLTLLRNQGNLDHVQIDAMDWNIPSEALGQDFFLYDINLCRFCDGTPDFERIARTTGVDVSDLSSLERAISTIFESNGNLAVAIKSQHAYHRTLRWQVRDESSAAEALDRWRRDGPGTAAETRNCLGDWCIDLIARLAAEHKLPFKLHTGYLNGFGGFPITVSRAEMLHELLHAHPNTNFVLMHIAYPYENELVAVAKQFPNVAIDLCWAWALNPRATSEFVRRMIHAVPSHKIFAFGGDSRLPAASVGYAFQARNWLLKTLEQEINDGFIDERGAIALAHQFMNANQYAFFDIEIKKARMRSSRTMPQLNPDQAIAIFDKATHAAWNDNPGDYRV
ncbi:amidohydrolase family protein (plasmid) [Sinorhizobium numidicum]|uniref:Amidohydrolase family protein n=1 Tax=Sinorhizobium numidicum TaxID=680248 RepID=A0ABY8D6G7_9HYPH|nr:amidohydrolase family protein [Sinorhizobium numidicum]WEX79596.1 amidohydrolase family protein [Sinorhizobium numidicum]WEX85448.1 amidohydrolase family protein [Sinorhizobium numidicum]